MRNFKKVMHGFIETVHDFRPVFFKWNMDETAQNGFDSSSKLEQIIHF